MTSAAADAAPRLTLYAWRTPNAQKVSILLEELGLAYEVVAIDIGAGEQFAPEFLAVSPNNRIPALIDPDGPDGAPVSLFESGAILIYLAEKHGRLLPAAGAARYEVLTWLMWQMAGVGPMFGQLGHFLMYAGEEVPYAVERYRREALRLYQVLDERLEGRDFIAGDYSIADIAVHPWVRLRRRHGIDLDALPNVVRWYARVKERPAVQKGYELLPHVRRLALDERQREVLFGDAQLRRGIGTI